MAPSPQPHVADTGVASPSNMVDLGAAAQLLELREPQLRARMSAEGVPLRQLVRDGRRVDAIAMEDVWRLKRNPERLGAPRDPGASANTSAEGTERDGSSGVAPDIARGEAAQDALLRLEDIGDALTAARLRLGEDRVARERELAQLREQVAELALRSSVQDQERSLMQVTGDVRKIELEALRARVAELELEGRDAHALREVFEADCATFVQRITGLQADLADELRRRDQLNRDLREAQLAHDRTLERLAARELDLEREAGRHADAVATSARLQATLERNAEQAERARERRQAEVERELSALGERHGRELADALARNQALEREVDALRQNEGGLNRYADKQERRVGKLQRELDAARELSRELARELEDEPSSAHSIRPGDLRRPEGPTALGGGEKRVAS